MRSAPLTMPLGLRLFLLRLLSVVLAVLFAAGAALAQSAEDPDAADPPGRVGSVTLLAGPVTMVDLATGSREEALLNWPVTGGWRIETGRAGRAEVRVGSTVLRLDEDTTVDFPRLDDQLIQVAVLRGGVALRLRNREVLNEIELLTQRERMVFEDVGRYRIDVDRPAGVTAVTAFAGRVRIGINRSTFVVGGGQRGELSASPMVSFEIAGAAADRFDEWAAARDAREDSVRSAAYVSRETTGVEQLDQYGDWRTVEDFGPVWFPRDVPATWAPYRYGRWVWVSPWGWTWVDEAPWGFAPLHYGRWTVVGGYWGWIPGVVVPRPIYAPALVAWFGVPAFGVSVGAPIGWFPLGPRELYVPAYRHTPRYLRVVNVQNVPNVAQVTIVQTPQYVHRHPDRSTWVSDDRFGRPEPVYRGQRPPPSEWRQYIARPQPPANVPNTKRRQATEGVAHPAPVRPPVTAPVDTRQAGRPASPVPRAVEAPRPAELPRAIEVPRAVEAPRAQPAAPLPAVRPEPSRGAGQPPAAAKDDRRMPPRSPGSSEQRPAAPYTPPAVRSQPRDVAPAPSPSMQPPAVPYSPPLRRDATVPPASPRSVETPAPRGRGDGVPREGQRQAPRGPSVPSTTSPPAAAAPPPAASQPAPAGGREAGHPPPARPLPPPRPDSGDPRGSDRPGAGREAAR